MRYYYYVAVKYYPFRTPVDNLRHCDVFGLQSQYSEYELRMKFQSSYAFLFGGYYTKEKAIEVANYHQYVIDNQ